MRPSHFHAPGMPNRLPDQKPYTDINGIKQSGKTVSYQKVLRSLLAHQAEELQLRTRDGSRSNRKPRGR